MYIQKGEVREVAIEIHSRANNPFTIDTAEYEIINYDLTSIEHGLATIDNQKIVTLFHARDIGVYYVIFTYTIGDETLKAKIKIEVIM